MSVLMTILAAIDVEQDPEGPISVGYDLAEAYDETLVALYVMSEVTYQDRQEAREELPEEVGETEFTVDQAMDACARQVTEAIEGTLADHDRDRIDARGRVGDPATEILAAAEELDPRFVVVGGRARSPGKQAIFGSVSQSIVHEATQPVVTVTGDGE